MNILKRIIYNIAGMKSIEDHPLYKQMVANGVIQKGNKTNESKLFGQSKCDIYDKFDDDFYKKLNNEGTVRINKDADALYVFFSKILGKALVSSDWDPVTKLLDEEITLTLYEDKEIVGKSNVINYWKDWLERYNEPYSGTKYIVKFCRYFSRTALLIIPRDSKPMYVVARLNNNLVKDLLLVPNPLQDSMIRYWDLDHESLSFDNCNQLYSDIGSDIEPKSMRIPCMTCGCKSKEMQWYQFRLSRKPIEYDGELSLCPECMKFVEYKPTCMYRLS